jgi:DNA-binding IclR family transcriptional regulator
MADSPDYAVPALDKALDILELLADQAGGLSQSEIAEATGRSTNQIFRVLALLERRGYLVRDTGLYVLSTRLFSLAHRHPPLRGLITAATAPMRELADGIRQSCNLSVLDAGRVLVIAQVESPADFGYRVRVGATFGVGDTATGMVLTGTDPFLERPDPLQPGITDVVVRIPGDVPATLTVPYVATTFSTMPLEQVRSRAMQAARSIGARLG